MRNKPKQSRKPTIPQADGPEEEPVPTPTAHNSHLTSWAHLPVLAKVLDYLEDPKDLAACALVCRAWREEADHDPRWKNIWSRKVNKGGEQGLWTWAKANGGYREQLKAQSIVRKGNCVATTFPFSHRDGIVSEVLFLDCSPTPRIITVQHRRPAAHVVRLQGGTIKLWTAAALAAQRPLLTIYDVVKHLQLEDGRLFLWHIADDVIIPTRLAGDGTAEEQAESRQWAQHPALVASALDPVTMTLTRLPLESSYGAGATPHEWMDMCAGSLAAASVSLSARRVSIRLFDIITGKCFRESSCMMPDVSGIFQPIQQDSALMLMTRNSDAEYQIIAAAVLFDCRVFRWRLKEEWLGPAAREKQQQRRRERQQKHQHQQQQQQQDEQQRGERGVIAEGGGGGGHAGVPGADTSANGATTSSTPSSSQGSSPPLVHSVVPPPLLGHDEGGEEESGEFVLHHTFTTPDAEPIVDISISTTARFIYVLGMENLYILGDDGRPQISCSMVQWRGVSDILGEGGPYDVGAFSWPFPSSARSAFYLDAANSLFVADFKNPPEPLNRELEDLPLRYPHIDHLLAYDYRTGGHKDFTLHSHVDLRPAPRTSSAAMSTGRVIRASDNEQVIVEYVQSGDVLFTGADSSCPAVGYLLKTEQIYGTYLQGLGPGTGASGSGSGSRGGPVLSRQGNGGGIRKDVAPRALVCIDVPTGKRFKAIPLEGALEAVHSAGHHVLAAVAPLDGFPDGVNGSLVVVDFSGEGFGVGEGGKRVKTQAQKRHAAPQAAATRVQGRRPVPAGIACGGGEGSGAPPEEGAGRSKRPRRRSRAKSP